MRSCPAMPPTDSTTTLEDFLEKIEALTATPIAPG